MICSTGVIAGSRRSLVFFGRAADVLKASRNAFATRITKCCQRLPSGRLLARPGITPKVGERTHGRRAKDTRSFGRLARERFFSVGGKPSKREPGVEVVGYRYIDGIERMKPLLEAVSRAVEKVVGRLMKRLQKRR